eukprot:CAMPEP_0202444274 /NCGR_PEP_ID=MMETSP1360-20130828/3413_1 /ASSEMBLY_ACC=CAM_ASM_000848 /TAXON_ID=515479 /ORGANISM="Licmophora paradoxa, Strain CCMP2313" /LENGTH=105 /DNA_ID=CAMNT_0049060235 /DNA_START=111 /DNA_END=428 /DNA_ORIENTATION=-
MVTPSPKSSSSGISSNISRFPSPIYNQALHDVTSQVVGAALETLRRDEAVGVAPPPLTSSSSSSLQAMARRQVQAEMMALQNQSSVNKLRYGMGVSRLPMMYLRR